MRPAQRIEQEAARWLMRREELDWNENEARAFEQWLEQSLAHKAEFWRLEHAWRQADRIGALGSAALGALPHTPSGQEEVLEAGDAAAPDDRYGGNVIRFPWRRHWQQARPRQRGIAAVIVLLAVVGLSLAVRTQDWLYPRLGGARLALAVSEPPADATHLETAVGHMKYVTLPDGSRIELNTATRIRASLESPTRKVWLEHGEAYFEVHHANNQPFFVYAGSRRITVLGTRFSVLRQGDEVKVSVVEGRVRVEDLRHDAPLASSVISAGDTVLSYGEAALVTKNENDRVERDLSWRSGILTFDQTELGAAAEQFNRYNTTHLEVIDPEAARIRIGGTFKASNVRIFVRLLRDAYGLKVEDKGKTIRISS